MMQPYHLSSLWHGTAIGQRVSVILPLSMVGNPWQILRPNSSQEITFCVFFPSRLTLWINHEKTARYDASLTNRWTHLLHVRM